MSGKPQFDEAAVIGAAVRVFWRHGYAATSINELTEATGLSRSSLYQRFGDKDGLFREALATYTARVLRRMNFAQADTARGRMKALLRAFLPDASAPRPDGCLIARSCAEMAELSAKGRAAARNAAECQRNVVVEILRDGAAKAELAPDADVEALAWLYLGVLQAILDFPAVGADANALNRMIDVAMSAWPNPA
jgi:TetR/AcrR family transcriptional regulator, copper-responsive repressor